MRRILAMFAANGNTITTTTGSYFSSSLSVLLECVSSMLFFVRKRMFVGCCRRRIGVCALFFPPIEEA